MEQVVSNMVKVERGLIMIIYCNLQRDRERPSNYCIPDPEGAELASIGVGH